ncbi:rhamnulokinase [bacterium]|nr:rhamnulokinase [bacterium]
MPGHFVAVDLGAGSGRVMLGTLENKLKLQEVHRFPNHQISVMGRLHWDVLRLFYELKQGLAVCSAQGHKTVNGIGVDTWGVDFGLLGRGDVLLGNPVCYRDSRTDGMMDRAFRKISKDSIYRHTGIQFMQLNTVFQLLSMVESRDPLLDAAEKLLFMPDLFHFLMTGKTVTEYTIATTSQLLNAKTGKWEPELFESLKIPAHIMQDIVTPGTGLGPLLPEIVRETGLHADVIASTSHDTASAVAAVPAGKGSWAYLSSGTWSLIGVETDRPIINPESLRNNFTNEGSVAGRIRFLKNVTGLWLLEECRRQWDKKEERDYGDLLGEASRAKPFRSLIDPDDGRFLNPPDMPTAIAGFCKETGQPVPETQGQFVRCILESMALKYRTVVRNMESLFGRKLDCLHIVGGGSRNSLLNQFTADATGLPVYAGPVEATAIGNILMQAVACGKLKSIEEGRDLVRRSFPMTTYEPGSSAAWEDQAALIH